MHGPPNEKPQPPGRVVRASQNQSCDGLTEQRTANTKPPALTSPENLQPRALYIGARRTGVTVEPDAVWPALWRVRQRADLSDLTNISRAKDAAIGWARPKGLGGDEVAHWRRRENRPAASPMRSFREAAE